VEDHDQLLSIYNTPPDLERVGEAEVQDSDRQHYELVIRISWLPHLSIVKASKLRLHQIPPLRARIIREDQ
jgi:hypothetical protein